MGDLVLLDEVPVSICVRISRNALEHDCGGAQGERAVDDVSVTSNPTNICHTSIDISGLSSKTDRLTDVRCQIGNRCERMVEKGSYLDVECIFSGQGSIHQISTS